MGNWSRVVAEDVIYCLTQYAAFCCAPYKANNLTVQTHFGECSFQTLANSNCVVGECEFTQFPIFTEDDNVPIRRPFLHRQILALV